MDLGSVLSGAERSRAPSRAHAYLQFWFFVWLLACANSAHAFSLDEVAKRANALAKLAYRAPENKLPKALRDLAYHDYQEIRFKPEQALWHNDKLPFEVMFFHPGRQYGEPVKVNEVSGQRITPFGFDPSQYDYGKSKFEDADLRGIGGHAGFRIHYAINRPNVKDEFLVFLGASYFRAVGKDQVYGLSARGLAVDVATSQGEEFPRFTEFWIERPQPKATSLVIYALMDSRRVTGAYRFDVVPGTETGVNVQSVLFPRENIEKLGLAPLTSMYLFGENQPVVDDVRPEVHDSDGLSIQTAAGEWLWRPLVNPQRLLVTSFTTPNPRGFGLMQRDRASSSYEDPDLLYERRPSTWVEPQGKWGNGRIELVQIPTPDDTNDNIVSYWIPEKPPAVLKPYAINYRMRWQMQQEARPPTSWVTQTRRGKGDKKHAEGAIKLLVDFDGPALKPLASETPVEAMVEADANGEILDKTLARSRATGQWRLTLHLKRRDQSKPVELRALLQQQKTVLSETWSYILPAQLEKP